MKHLTSFKDFEKELKQEETPAMDYEKIKERIHLATNKCGKIHKFNLKTALIASCVFVTLTSTLTLAYNNKYVNQKITQLFDKKGNIALIYTNDSDKLPEEKITENNLALKGKDFMSNIKDAISLYDKEISAIRKDLKTNEAVLFVAADGTTTHIENKNTFSTVEELRNSLTTKILLPAAAPKNMTLGNCSLEHILQYNGKTTDDIELGYKRDEMKETAIKLNNKYSILKCTPTSIPKNISIRYDYKNVTHAITLSIRNNGMKKVNFISSDPNETRETLNIGNKQVLRTYNKKDLILKAGMSNYMFTEDVDGSIFLYSINVRNCVENIDEIIKSVIAEIK